MYYEEQYRRASDALNLTLLDGRHEDRPLYLVLDERGRAEVAEALDIEAPDVERVICQVVGKVLHEPGNPYEGQLQDARKWWRLSREDPPPFTATLFALSHAAELMSDEGDFSGGNFYDRLGIAMEYPADRLRFHGRQTAALWHMFNAWLTQNDYEFGRPTAKPFNSNIHVNLPQSQALVRAGDKKRFHLLFERYGFSSGDDVTVDEMGVYISSWINSSEANDRLRGAWGKPQLRERFCEAVLAELADWTEPDALGRAHQGSHGNQQLTLVAALEPDFPRTRLALQLGKRSETGEILEGLSIGGSDKAVSLGNFTYGSIATLSPNILQEAEVLDRGVTLSSNEDESAGFSWRPRAVVPLARSSVGPYWQATTRLGLGVEHLVLVKDTPRLRGLFEAYLSDATTGTAVVASVDELPGLPSGWLLYKDVLVVNSRVQTEDDLMPVVPLDEGTSLLVTGGLRIGGGIWHAEKPPRIDVLSTERGTELAVSENSPESEQLEERFVVSHQGRIGSINPARLQSLGSGEYVVKARANGKISATLPVTLRSANKPRPLHRQNKGRLVYSSCFSAEPLESETTKPMVEGFIVHGDQGGQVIHSGEMPSPEIPNGSEETLEIAYPMRLEPTVRSETCVSRGYHHWVCDMLPPGLPKATPLAMECKDCKQFTVLKDRGKPKKDQRRPAKPMSKWSNSFDDHSADIDQDVLLDALCYLGSGTWGRLETLLSSATPKPSDVASIAGNLCALGLLDVAIGRGSGRPQRWSVPAPFACFTSKTRAFLGGFRAEAFVAEIAEWIELAGGTLAREDFADRPRAVWLEGLDAESLKSALEEVEDPLGRRLRILGNGSAALARTSLAMKGVEPVFSPMSLGQAGVIERFNPATGRWERDDDTGRPGAYRVDHAGRTYVYRDRSGTARRGPYQLVKTLAARGQGVRLHAYLPSEQRFLATLGAEPIGLLARCLVGASGRLPTIEKGIVSYNDVPEELAAIVLQYLYEEPVCP